MNYTVHMGAIKSPPTLTTDRLIMRPITEAYRHYVFEGLSHREVRNAIHLPALESKEQQDGWWKKFEAWRKAAKAIQWCAFTKHSGVYIGLMTVKEIDAANARGEIGYSIVKPYWRQGYGQEAAKRVLQYAFDEVNLHTLLAQVAADNIGSQKIIKALGMELEGHLKEAHLYDGKFYDLLQFSIINPNHKKIEGL